MKAALLIDMESTTSGCKRKHPGFGLNYRALVEDLENDNYEIVSKSVYSPGGFGVPFLTMIMHLGYEAQFNRPFYMIDITIKALSIDAEAYIILTDSLAVRPLVETLLARDKHVILMSYDPMPKLEAMTEVVNIEGMYLHATANTAKRVVLSAGSTSHATG